MKKIARAPVEVKYGMPLLSNSNKDFLSQDLSKIISKDAMNINGLSKATLKTFIDKGWVTNFIDIYNLKNLKNELYKLDGFGKTYVDKLLDAIEKSKKTTIFTTRKSGQ